MTGGTKTPTPTEHEEQTALIEWWSWYSQWMGLQKCLLMAIPNGGARTTDYRCPACWAKLRRKGGYNLQDTVQDVESGRSTMYPDGSRI